MKRGRKPSKNPKDIRLQIRINKELDASLKNFAKTCGNLKKSEAARIILESVLLQKKII